MKLETTAWVDLVYETLEFECFRRNTVDEFRACVQTGNQDIMKRAT